MAQYENQRKLSWRARIASLGNVCRLFSMLWATSPALLIAGATLHLFRAVLPFALLWIPKLILDGIVAISRGHGDLRRVWWLLSLEMLLALAADVMSRANSLVDSLLSDRFANHLAMRIIDHASLLDLSMFEDPAFSDKLDRVRGQADGRTALLTSVFNLTQDGITLVILASGLSIVSPWLLVFVVVSTIPTFIGETHFSQLAYSVFYRRTPQRRELDYLRLLGSSLLSAKEVRIFNLASHLSQKYHAVSERIYEDNKQVASKRAWAGGALGLFSALGYYSAYAWVLGRALVGAISIGTFAFLTGSFSRSRDCGQRILLNVSNISEQAVLLNDLFEFFRIVPVIRSPPNAVPAPRPIRAGFEFRNVSFAYPGSERLVVRNINLRIYPSEKIALIGENGAGKTTLVKLLSRLYDPSGGEILLDGVDLREYDVSALRQQISVVFQDFMRYDLSVRENIGFGDLSSLTDDRRLRTAAQKSGAQAVIDRLPKGYDQVLGRRFEDGIDLSGGEWQKVALARAYARDAQLLILDEPTASLDVRAEHEIFTRFAELMEGRMAVLISHRFSTVRMADRIVVLEDGAIQEEGTHEQLIRLDGQYSELFELQAAGFRAAV